MTTTTSAARWLTCAATFAAYVAVVQLFPVVSVPPENVALLWVPTTRSS